MPVCQKRSTCAGVGATNATWTRCAVGCASSVCVRAKLPQTENVGVLVVCSISSSSRTAVKAVVAVPRSATRSVTWSNIAARWRVCVAVVAYSAYASGEISPRSSSSFSSRSGPDVLLMAGSSDRMWIDDWCRLDRSAAAVGCDGGAGDVARAWGREEGDDLGDLLGLRGAAHRSRLSQRGDELRA